MANINNLQLYKSKRFEGLVDQNKLSTAFFTQPEVVNKTLSLIFGFHYGNPIALLTGGIGKTKFVGNNEFEWNLMGDLEEPAVIVEDLTGADGTAGVGGAIIELVLNRDMFVSGEVAVTDSRNYSLIVIGEREQVANGFKFSFQLLDSSENLTKSVPKSLFTPGRELSKDFTAYAEGDTRSGITTFGTPFKMRNRLTIHRKHRDITGSAATDVMVIAMKDPESGKTSYLWEDLQNWIFLAQWYRELDRALVYNQYGQTQAPNGRPVFTGAGLRQQIAPANKRDYTVLTENVIREFLMDLSYNVLDKGQRKFVALCGEGFMDLFDRAMKDSIGGLGMVLQDTKFITGSGQELSFGGQFKTYKGLNGTEVTLMHFPCYDDPIHNRELHPVYLRPLESYRATFIEYGHYDGETNIQKIAKNGREQLMWTTGGSMGPNGGHTSPNTLASNSFDGYKVEALAEIGIKLHNPLSCGELIPSVQGL